MKTGPLPETQDIKYTVLSCFQSKTERQEGLDQKILDLENV